MAVTNHAKIRGKQRSISLAEMMLLTAFGRAHRKPGNAVEYFLDHDGFLQLEGVLREGVQLLDKLKSQILITDDNQNVITCYHKSQRRI